MGKHWTEKLFIEKPCYYKTTLGKVIKRASAEVTGLMNIFSKLKVPEDGLILDICCGIGRHSVVLAERGFKIVGVDISPEFIARAKESAVERKVSHKVDFRVVDMRDLTKVFKDYKRKFDATINIFTSLGYYNEKTDKNILQQISELTKNNGVLVIDIANRDEIIRHLLPKDITQIDDNLVNIEERRINLENSRMETVWKYYRKHGDDLKHMDTFELDFRVYSLHELKRLVEESGWTYQTCYGRLNLEPFTMESKRIVLIAKKTMIDKKKHGQRKTRTKKTRSIFKT
jgi:SAM-dependent methyltransferase